MSFFGDLRHKFNLIVNTNMRFPIFKYLFNTSYPLGINVGSWTIIDLAVGALSSLTTNVASGLMVETAALRGESTQVSDLSFDKNNIFHMVLGIYLSSL